MSPKDRSHVIDEITQAHIRPGLNLLPGVLAQVDSEKQASLKTWKTARVAAVLLALILLIALFSQPVVVSALKNLVGYIPGVGTVDQNAPIRVLANPVTDSQAGYTITVDSAVLDSNRTVLSYQISGHFPTWDDPALKPVMCQGYPILRLAEGQELANQGSAVGISDETAQGQLIFPAVPPSENQATLVLPCLSELPDGEGPHDWEIPLAFVPAPADMPVYPVIELPTQTPVNPGGTQAEQDMQLSLQSTAVLEDGYYLETVLSWQHDPGTFEFQIFHDAVHLFDANHQEVPVWLAGQTAPAAPAENESLKLSLQTGPIFNPGPASLVLDYAGMSIAAGTRFSFDAGEDPQPGQIWDLNKDLVVAGYPLRVLTAEYVPNPDGQMVMLMLHLEAGPDVLMVTAMDTDHEITGTGGSPNSEYVPFRAGWYYLDGFPEGTITVEITTITIRRTGPWSVTWTPPVTPAAPTPQAPIASNEPALCLDGIKLADVPTELPAGLTGRVAYSQADGENHELFVSNLDGSDRISLGYGIFPDLSLDGARAAYVGTDEGLHVQDLVSGADARILEKIGEGIYMSSVKWSPDGQLLAVDVVTGHTSDIYLVRPDGTNLQAVIDGPDNEHFLNWSPDSRYFSFTVAGEKGRSIWVHDLQTGSATEASQLPTGTFSARLSANGSRLLYTTEQGMFLDIMDNTGAALLVASSTSFGNQIYPIWSPDGQWIAMTVWETEADAKPGLALLQPDTCQIVRPPNQKAGWLWSWVP